jgi:Asp-tRNA(Asn)/Glu-tRNA(Gln) amidotransferase A subunit family amidase
VHGYLERIQAMTPADYRRALERRDALRRLHRALRGKVDAFITLAHIGPGQKGLPAVGTPWYNDPSSAIGAPTLNLPVLRVEGVPLGVQLMGYEHEDYALVAMARALLAADA